MIPFTTTKLEWPNLRPGARLIKHCDKKNNIARGVCNTIALGTMYKYKEGEIVDYSDRTEGDASFSQAFINDRIQMRDNDFNFTLPNCSYIFCASLEGGVFQGYDDLYYINDYNKFLHLVAMLLRTNITFDDFEDEIPEGNKYDLRADLCEINYGKGFNYWGTLFDDIIDGEIWGNAIFRKPESFSHQKEVRFAFTVKKTTAQRQGSEDWRLYSFKKAPKILDITPLRHEFDKIISLT